MTPYKYIGRDECKRGQGYGNGEYEASTGRLEEMRQENPTEDEVEGTQNSGQACYALWAETRATTLNYQRHEWTWMGMLRWMCEVTKK